MITYAMCFRRADVVKHVPTTHLSARDAAFYALSQCPTTIWWVDVDSRNFTIVITLPSETPDDALHAVDHVLEPLRPVGSEVLVQRASRPGGFIPA